MARRILISVTNDLVLDQRVHRVATALVEAGHQVKVLGRLRPESQDMPEMPYQTHRIRVWFQKGKLFYAEHAFRLFFYLLFSKVDVLWANDMDTLLANTLVAKIRRKRLLYDSHEYWTEIPELLERPGTRRMWLRLERWLFPRADAAMTVNASIAEAYAKAYDRKVGYIRNLPISKPEPPLREQPGHVLIYQGALNMGRGLDLMIQAMDFLPEFELWLVGWGSQEAEIRALATESSSRSRIHFKGVVHFSELYLLTEQAAVGLSLEEDRGGSYHFALPNKLFDYIQSGIPVVVSDLPEMRAVVDQYQVGKVMEEDQRQPEVLAEMVRSICEPPAEWQRLRAKCLAARTELCWEQEQKRLFEIAGPLLK